jgi:Family of unknown function (DUF6152)
MAIHKMEGRAAMINKMTSKLIVGFALAVGLLVSIPLSAHHGAASIYDTKTVSLKGTVKTWLWSNPHCLLTFDVKGDDGKVVEWIAETQAPSTVYPQGFRKDSFKPGDQVTVIVQPARNERPNGRMVSAVTADGTKLGSTGEGGGRGGRGGDEAPY